MKRILDQFGTNTLTKKELLKSIKMSEGRTMVSEVICIAPSLLHDISNLELAKGFGADIILLNMFDVDYPVIDGITSSDPQSIIRKAKSLTGGYYGVNLEPIDTTLVIGDHTSITRGRLANIENVRKLIEQDIDMVVLTGNPKVGVSHQSLIKSIHEIHSRFSEDIIIVAGRMHAAGDENAIGEELINEEMLIEMMKAGADIILLPAPGTIPGLSATRISELVRCCHHHHKMVMTTIGTSQEGADTDTIKRIAFHAKSCGADLHHIGDCGYGPGIAVPENIMHYSIVIKGRRHTYRRMVGSINR